MRRRKNDSAKLHYTTKRKFQGTSPPNFMIRLRDMSRYDTTQIFVSFFHFFQQADSTKFRDTSQRNFAIRLSRIFTIKARSAWKGRSTGSFLKVISFSEASAMSPSGSFRCAKRTTICAKRTTICADAAPRLRLYSTRGHRT